jgi:hypothetical protein
VQAQQQVGELFERLGFGVRGQHTFGNDDLDRHF